MSISSLHQTSKENRIGVEKAPIRDLVPKDIVALPPQTSQEHALERLRGSAFQAPSEVLQVERLRDKKEKTDLPSAWKKNQDVNPFVAFMVGVCYSFAFACLSPLSGQGLWPWARMVLLVSFSAALALFVVKTFEQPTWISALLIVVLVFLSGFVYNLTILSYQGFLVFKQKMIENGKKYME